MELCGRATHAWQAQDETPDQAGHGAITPRAVGGGSVLGRVCLSDVPVQANQRQCNSGRGPQKKRLRWSQQHGRGRPRAISGQGRGNRSNEVPWTWHQRQLQQQAVFLVSRSLTLSSAHISFSTVAGFVMLTISPAAAKKKTTFGLAVRVFNH